MTHRVLVFAEDILGATLARDLADRVVVERGPDWLGDLWRDPVLRASQREFSGVDAPDAWTKWVEIPSLTARHRVVTHGLGLKGYSVVAYRAARLAARLKPLPDAVVFCIDSDGDDSVRAQMLEGLERARVDDVPFLLAVAHQEAEAWVIAGFVPENNAERTMLADLTREHGFDPTSEPHRLTPRRPIDPRDAKRVCGTLVPEGPASLRGERCWLDVPLGDLEQRGKRTGLPEYLSDVAVKVLPLLGSRG